MSSTMGETLPHHLVRFGFWGGRRILPPLTKHEGARGRTASYRRLRKVRAFVQTGRVVKRPHDAQDKQNSAKLTFCLASSLASFFVCACVSENKYQHLSSSCVSTPSSAVLQLFSDFVLFTSEQNERWRYLEGKHSSKFLCYADPRKGHVEDRDSRWRMEK